MRGIIKTFIEENIDLIETKNYYQLFKNWGDNYVYDESVDSANLQYLFKVMREAGIDLEGDSLSARELVIFDQFEKYVKDAAYLSDVTDITLPQAIKQLKSNLDVRLTTRRDLFHEVADKLNLRYQGMHIYFER